MFIEPNIEAILSITTKLNSESKPLWGNMGAQRMIEHLSEMVRVSSGKVRLPLEIGEERIPKMVAFLESEKPMAKNIEVSFAPKAVPLRNEELDLAIDELVEEWLDFEEHFENSPEKTEIHPYYGALNFEQWKKLHSKHFSHHFEQFGIM